MHADIELEICMAGVPTVLSLILLLQSNLPKHRSQYLFQLQTPTLQLILT